MANDQIPDSAAADQLLVALERQLRATELSYDLVVVGGSALLALGLVDRPTRDVDVVAFSDAGGLRTAAEFPEGLKEARDAARVRGTLDDATVRAGASGPLGVAGGPGASQVVCRGRSGGQAPE